MLAAILTIISFIALCKGYKSIIIWDKRKIAGIKSGGIGRAWYRKR